VTGKPQDPAKRLATLQSRITPGPGGCWIWTGYRMPNGYGLFSMNGRKIYAHRASYELSVGAVPEGMHIDHLCRVRACIRPDHLEAVTQAENNNRAAGTRDKCRRWGHPLDGIKTSDGRETRYCKTCHRIREAARYATNRGKA
jgi:HNH endonuclease